MEELSSILQTDKERAETSPAAKRAKAEIDRVMATLPESIRGHFSADDIGMPPRSIDHLPDHLREARLSGDPVRFNREIAFKVKKET